LSCAFFTRPITPSCVLRSQNRVLTLGAGVLLVLLSVLAGRALQLEFLPKLEEGIYGSARPCRSPSLEEGNASSRMRAVIKSFRKSSPWSRSTEGRMTARYAGFYNGEFYVPLKPPSEWPKRRHQGGVDEGRRRQVAGGIPGVDFNARRIFKTMSRKLRPA